MKAERRWEDGRIHYFGDNSLACPQSLYHLGNISTVQVDPMVAGICFQALRLPELRAQILHAAKIHPSDRRKQGISEMPRLRKAGSLRKTL